MNSDELLKQKRSNILSELVNKIKEAINKNKIKGEKSSKIFIYSRLADYTFYSEVSIRKFLTGILPKDISSFIEGIIAYSKYVGIEEEYLQEFAKAYVSAANAIIISQDSKIKTRNNLIPQDLTSIIRPKKLTEFLDNFLKDDVNISYIYGYSLTGKTKSVMAYISDVINRNVYENIMWQELKEENQKEYIYNLILNFTTSNKENVDREIKEEVCINFLKNSKSIIVLDFDQCEIKKDVLSLLKEIAKYTKIIIISSNPFNKYEKELEFYTRSFSTNNFIEKQEFEKMLRLNNLGNIVLDNKPELIEKLYILSGGFPFVATYILKQIIEENQMGVPLNEAIEKHSNYETNEYGELASKIIEKSWNGLSNLAKQIIITCSKFKYSVSSKLVAYICNIEVTNPKWREALKELYDKDLITSIILNNPRFDVNNMIKVLVLIYSKEEYDEKNFVSKISEYYVELSKNIGECYNDLDKLKILDDIDEWNIVLQVLDYLESSKKYKEYISIVRELKYYIYVRGMWKLGDESLHLKRSLLAKEINNKTEELEGLCDYINICSKSKNKQEAEKYLEVAKKIVDENYDNIDKRVICLYFHVQALYLNNCLGDYKKAYDIWVNNREKYFDYVNEYRKLVNRLWEDRCYLKIEKNIDKVCDRLIESLNNVKEKNFTRCIVDYELLIASKKVEKFEKTKDINCLNDAKIWLEEAKEILESNSKDIRNEAFYYKLQAIISKYEDNQEEKNKFVEKAIELYKLMNCKQDIIFLEYI